jgi:iron(III) transport system permease protein
MAQASLEMGPTAAFFRVALPMAGPWWITAQIGTAMLAATEMTVADLYGFRTVADQFYLFYSLDPDPWSILAICFVPLLVASATLLTWSTWRRRFVTQREQTLSPTLAPEPSGSLATATACVFAIAITSLLVGIPMVGLLFKVGQDVAVIDGVTRIEWSPGLLVSRLAESPRIFAAEYRWTAIIAAATASLCVAIAWPLAFMGRSSRTVERWLDLASIALVCVPGPIVGLIIVGFFQSGLPMMTTLYQQTIVPTVIGLSFRAGAVAYWILRSGYRGIDRAVLESASLEMSRRHRFWALDRRIIARPAIAAWLAAALVSSGDLPVLLPVIPAGVTTVSVRLFGLLHSGARYQESSLAFWYIAAVVVIAGTAHWTVSAMNRNSSL